MSRPEKVLFTIIQPSPVGRGFLAVKNGKRCNTIRKRALQRCRLVRMDTTDTVDLSMAHALATSLPVQYPAPLTRDEEIRLIADACVDAKAFAPLYEKYYDRVYLYLLRRCANQSLAEDLTAEVFFKAMRKLSTYKPQNVPFLAWLFRVAHNQLMSHYRKEKVRFLFRIQKEKEQPFFADPRVRLLYQSDLNTAGCVIARLIRKLKPRDQLLLTLRYFEELSIQEAAAAADMNPGAARTRINRAIRKLRNLIESEAPELASVIAGGQS